MEYRSATPVQDIANYQKDSLTMELISLPGSLDCTTQTAHLPHSELPATPPTASTSPIHTNRFEEPLHTATLPRFIELLNRVKSLVHTYGPHTTHNRTAIFARASSPSPRTMETSTTDLAETLAAAQDSISDMKADGVLSEDLKIFKQFWDTTVCMLEDILQSRDLEDHATFGWSIFGLSAGYMHPRFKQPDPQFKELKARLHAALFMLSSLDPPLLHQTEEMAISRKEEETKIRAIKGRHVHICANLLLQQFRREEWKRIRWWHGIAVVERWIEQLGWTPCVNTNVNQDRLCVSFTRSSEYRVEIHSKKETVESEQGAELS